MDLNKIPEEKKKKTIEAAILEFANNNYDSASTNKIVETAGISKGLLFHYFGSKKKLYLYCVDVCIEIYKNGFEESVGNGSSDIFERIVEYNIIKAKFFIKYPNEYQVLWGAIVSSPEEIKKEVNEKLGKVSAEFMPELLKGIDTSMIKEKFDVNTLIEILTWIGEGYSKKYVQMYETKKVSPLELIDKDLIMEDLYKYLDIVKHGFYK